MDAEKAIEIKMGMKGDKERLPQDCFSYHKEAGSATRVLPKMYEKVSGAIKGSCMIKWGVFAFCIVASLSQTYSLLSLYVRHPTSISVLITRSTKLELPGITICNSNGIKLSELKAIPEFKAKWDAVHANDNGTYVKLESHKLIDEYWSYILTHKSIKEFMSVSHTYEEIIVTNFTKCASDEKTPDHLCKNYTNVLTTAQNIGICYTFFHESVGGKLTNVTVKAGYSNSPVILGDGRKDPVEMEISQMPIQPNEVIRFKVDHHRAEYSTLNEPIFGTVTIHDPKELPSTRPRKLTIKPGAYYEIDITEQVSELLEPPFEPGCFDYLSANEWKYKGSKRVHQYLEAPLSQEDCLVGCLGRHTTRTCNCWPPELPFLPMAHSSADTGFNRLKWCNWTDLKLTPNISNYLVKFEFCFSRFDELCRRECRTDCRKSRYSVHQVRQKWPAQERIEHSATKEYLEQQRNCCSIISIRYLTAEDTIHSQEPKLEDVEVFSYLGGLLSIWLGFSFLGLYKCIKRMLFAYSSCIGEKRVNLIADFLEITEKQR